MNTDQEIFDFVVKKVIAQGEASMHPTNKHMCGYRGPQGACAAGHLIKDEFYAPEMEGFPASHPEVLDAIQLSYPDWDANKYLLSTLQGAHDNASNADQEDFVPQFKASAANVAKNFGLEFNHV